MHRLVLELCATEVSEESELKGANVIFLCASLLAFQLTNVGNADLEEFA